MMTFSAIFPKPGFDTNKVKVVRDNQTVQQVLDSITDAAEENQFVVFLPPRVYLLDEPLVCKEWIHLVCPAPYGAILRPTFEANHKLIKFASNIYVHGIYMDAEYKTLGSLIPKDAHDIAIRNCLFQRNKAATGCSVWGYNVLFENCIARYSHGDDGFSVEEVWDDELGDYVYGHNVTYINCKSYNHSEQSGTQHGFEIEDGCYDVTFINCEAWNCGGIGIHSHSGMKACSNITIIGGRYSRFESSIAEPNERLVNLHITGALIEPYWNKTTEFNTSVNPSLWRCDLRSLKDSYINMKVRNLSVEISSCENTIFNLKTENAERVNFSGCSNCDFDLSSKRWADRPKHDLSVDASIGDNIIHTSSIEGFEIGMRLQISDSNNSEYVIVKNINEDTNTIELTKPLENSYIVTNNAVIEMPYWRMLSCHGDDANFLKVHKLEGQINYPSVTGNTKIIFDSNNTISVEDLNSDKTLYPYSETTLLLNPNGADRNIVPITWSNCFCKGFKVTIKNIGDTYNLIFDPSGLNLTIQPGQSANVIYDGNQWRQI